MKLFEAGLVIFNSESIVKYAELLELINGIVAEDFCYYHEDDLVNLALYTKNNLDRYAYEEVIDAVISSNIEWVRKSSFTRKLVEKAIAA